MKPTFLLTLIDDFANILGIDSGRFARISEASHVSPAHFLTFIVLASTDCASDKHASIYSVRHESSNKL